MKAYAGCDIVSGLQREKRGKGSGSTASTVVLAQCAGALVQGGRRDSENVFMVGSPGLSDGLDVGMKERKKSRRPLGGGGLVCSSVFDGHCSIWSSTWFLAYLI